MLAELLQYNLVVVVSAYLQWCNSVEAWWPPSLTPRLQSGVHRRSVGLAPVTNAWVIQQLSAIHTFPSELPPMGSDPTETPGLPFVEYVIQGLEQGFNIGPTGSGNATT